MHWNLGLLNMIADLIFVAFDIFTYSPKTSQKSLFVLFSSFTEIRALMAFNYL